MEPPEARVPSTRPVTRVLDSPGRAGDPASPSTPSNLKRIALTRGLPPVRLELEGGEPGAAESPTVGSSPQLLSKGVNSRPSFLTPSGPAPWNRFNSGVMGSPSPQTSSRTLILSPAGAGLGAKLVATASALSMRLGGTPRVCSASTPRGTPAASEDEGAESGPEEGFAPRAVPVPEEGRAHHRARRGSINARQSVVHALHKPLPLADALRDEMPFEVSTSSPLYDFFVGGAVNNKLALIVDVLAHTSHLPVFLSFTCPRPPGVSWWSWCGRLLLPSSAAAASAKVAPNAGTDGDRASIASYISQRHHNQHLRATDSPEQSLHVVRSLEAAFQCELFKRKVPTLRNIAPLLLALSVAALGLHAARGHTGCVGFSAAAVAQALLLMLFSTASRSTTALGRFVLVFLSMLVPWTLLVVTPGVFDRDVAASVLAAVASVWLCPVIAWKSSTAAFVLLVAHRKLAHVSDEGLDVSDHAMYTALSASLFLMLGGWLFSLELVQRRHYSAEWLLASQQRLMRCEGEFFTTMLQSVLPEQVIVQLYAKSYDIAQEFDDVTVMFVEIANFTPATAGCAPEVIIEVLNLIFSAFDVLCDFHDVYKVETVGPVYMVVGGCPQQVPNHAHLLAHIALDMMEAMPALRQSAQAMVGGAAELLGLRIGLNTGPLVAGIVGNTAPRYKLFGDTVNTSARMETTSELNRIQMTESTRVRIEACFTTEERGQLFVKGKGMMTTHYLTGMAHAHVRGGAGTDCGYGPTVGAMAPLEPICRPVDEDAVAEAFREAGVGGGDSPDSTRVSDHVFAELLGSYERDVAMARTRVQSYVPSKSLDMDDGEDGMDSGISQGLDGVLAAPPVPPLLGSASLGGHRAVGTIASLAKTLRRAMTRGTPRGSPLAPVDPLPSCGVVPVASPCGESTDGEGEEVSPAPSPNRHRSLMHAASVGAMTMLRHVASPSSGAETNALPARTSSHKLRDVGKSPAVVVGGRRRSSLKTRSAADVLARVHADSAHNSLRVSPLATRSSQTPMTATIKRAKSRARIRDVADAEDVAGSSAIMQAALTAGDARTLHRVESLTPDAAAALRRAMPGNLSLTPVGGIKLRTSSVMLTPKGGRSKSYDEDMPLGALGRRSLSVATRGAPGGTIPDMPKYVSLRNVRARPAALASIWQFLVLAVLGVLRGSVGKAVGEVRRWARQCIIGGFTRGFSVLRRVECRSRGAGTSSHSVASSVEGVAGDEVRPAESVSSGGGPPPHLAPPPRPILCGLLQVRPLPREVVRNVKQPKAASRWRRLSAVTSLLTKKPRNQSVSQRAVGVVSRLQALHRKESLRAQVVWARQLTACLVAVPALQAGLLALKGSDLEVVPRSCVTACLLVAALCMAAGSEDNLKWVNVGVVAAFATITAYIVALVCMGDTFFLGTAVVGAVYMLAVSYIPLQLRLTVVAAMIGVVLPLIPRFEADANHWLTFQNKALGAVVFVALVVIFIVSAIQLEFYQLIQFYRTRLLREQRSILEAEKTRSHRLLTNILPESIIERLQRGDHLIAGVFDEVTIVFTDMVGFTNFSSGLTASKLLTFLNAMFVKFDRLTTAMGAYKVEIIGDAYYVVGNCPNDMPGHAAKMVDLAVAMLKELPGLRQAAGTEAINIRVGVHTGPVVAGVIGITDPRYHLFGDTVSYAMGMESSGVPGCVHVSQATKELLGPEYVLEARTATPLETLGEQGTFLLQDAPGGVPTTTTTPS